MMNNIGKGLVLVFTLFSLLSLALAVVIYFEFIDWGRAEPRVVRGEITKGSTANDQRIPSEYDKSVVIFDVAIRGRNLALAPVEAAEESLREVAVRFPENHLFYVAKLKELRTDDGVIDVKAITPDGIPSDHAGRPNLGKPIPDLKVEGLDRSLVSYDKELTDQLSKLADIEAKIRKFAEQNAGISQTLTGKDENGKKQFHGLYELIDQEFATQQRLKQERDYLQPLWATEVEKARRFASRRLDLEETLAGLEKTLKAKQDKEK